MLSYQSKAEIMLDVIMSQSPSEMECSPTTGVGKENTTCFSRSPQLKWNALLLLLLRWAPFFLQRRSPHLKWNALLRMMDGSAGVEYTLSQSPSEMECSPTVDTAEEMVYDYSRSPHLKWNALLR